MEDAKDAEFRTLQVQVMRVVASLPALMPGEAGVPATDADLRQMLFAWSRMVRSIEDPMVTPPQMIGNFVPLIGTADSILQHPPDVTYQLRDMAIQAVGWLIRRAEAMLPTHSSDFTTVHWFGTKYTFDAGMQSESVRALWSEWEQTGMGLHQGTIGQQIDPERRFFRMDKIFRDHPAFGTMIQRIGDGKYALVPTSSTKDKSGITAKTRRKPA